MPAQAFGKAMFDKDEWGVLYNSVRKAGGECAAILRPPALAKCTQAGHYRYIWNGKEQRIVGYFRISENTFIKI